MWYTTLYVMYWWSGEGVCLVMLFMKLISANLRFWHIHKIIAFEKQKAFYGTFLILAQAPQELAETFFTEYK